MEYRHDPQSHSYVVSLFKEEDLRSSIQSLAQKERIHGAMISAIGALKDPELGYYDLERQTYSRRKWLGLWELVQLSGNISFFDNQPLLHVHATISGNDFTAHSGHLFDAKVGVMVELFITCSQGPIHRLHNAEVGLPQMRPCHTPKA